jgi:beta-lactamase class D
MSMREAIGASAVPIYQELARRIGLERYQQWLARLGFGNRQTGAALETFWLDGPRQISAIEQARFVANLAQGKLDCFGSFTIDHPRYHSAGGEGQR